MNDWAKFKVDEACEAQKKICVEYGKQDNIIFPEQLINAPKPEISYE